VRRAAGVLLAALLVTGAAACEELATPSATVPSATALVPDSPPPTPSSTAAPSTAGSRPSVQGGRALEDPSLLDLLPPDVAGIPVGIEHQAFVEAVAEPGFAQAVRGAAFGVATDGTDLVSGVVAELEPGLFGDSFFRDWRNTYNEGACSQAGGVVGNAEADIGGRTVYIATCSGGVRTYHAWVPERGAIVSAFALGEKRLGETLMEGLRP
jgi:hypothetical protein